MRHSKEVNIYSYRRTWKYLEISASSSILVLFRDKTYFDDGSLISHLEINPGKNKMGKCSFQVLLLFSLIIHPKCDG